MNKTAVQQIVERLREKAKECRGFAETEREYSVRSSYLKKANDFLESASIAAEFLEVEKKEHDTIFYNARNIGV